jgi:hypothetical protein
MVGSEVTVSGSDPDEGKNKVFPEVCGNAVRCYRPLTPAAGEALMVATEDLASLVLLPEWSPKDCAQMRDLARHAMGIINSVRSPPAR